MKKHLLSILALVLAAAALAAAVTARTVKKQYEDDIAALTYLVEDLRGKVAALSDQTSTLCLGDTALSAVQCNDGTADVTFTLRPADPDAKGTPLLKLLVGDILVTQQECEVNGDAYTATINLSPVNGLTYILSWNGTECVLASPDNGAHPHLVNLADSLSAYCNLVLEDWNIEGTTLTLGTCHVQIQAPLLGETELPQTQEAQVLLKHRGQVLDGVTITVAPGEGSASYEGILENLSLTLPLLAEGEEISLWLEAVLADGQMVSACAGTWTTTAGGYEMAAG